MVVVVVVGWGGAQTFRFNKFTQEEAGGVEAGRWLRCEE